jgi:hypothetical protein
MGKTVKPFRVALEGEIGRWKAFRRSDREAFDELMDSCRRFASGSGLTVDISAQSSTLSAMIFARTAP